MVPTLAINELWLVVLRLVDETGHSHDELQFWRAPEGRTGQKRIVRASHAQATVLGAAPLASFSQLGVSTQATLGENIKQWLHGPERAVLVTGDGDAPPQVVLVRGKTCKEAQAQASSMGHGAIVSISLEDLLPRLSLMRAAVVKQDMKLLNQDLIRTPPGHGDNGKLLPSELAEYDRAQDNSDWSQT